MFIRPIRRYFRTGLLAMVAVAMSAATRIRQHSLCTIPAAAVLALAGCGGDGGGAPTPVVAQAQGYSQAPANPPRQQGQGYPQQPGPGYPQQQPAGFGNGQPPAAGAGYPSGQQPSYGNPQDPGGRSGGNPLDQLMQWERQDMGVRPSGELHTGAMHGPTPNQIPGGQVITTKGLLPLLQGTQGVTPVVLDVLGSAQQLPNAIPATMAAQAGSFKDPIQQQFGQMLQQVTRGNREVPLVLYCQGPQCWMSYNAALRAINLGYRNVLWYRGGLEAWQRAGLPVANAQQRPGPPSGGFQSGQPAPGYQDGDPGGGYAPPRGGPRGPNPGGQPPGGYPGGQPGGYPR